MTGYEAMTVPPRAGGGPGAAPPAPRSPGGYRAGLAWVTTSGCGLIRGSGDGGGVPRQEGLWLEWASLWAWIGAGLGASPP